ncbi:MAG TPA: DUF2293 domain-containing protein [Verrucomicrobiae bacterium]|nr:DUF2293 domain-containing protein [Verrucomicrobiae bacterium]
MWACAEQDREFVAGLAGVIASQYPGCPGAGTRRIAEHTGRRHSSRVGRSAADRAYEASAVTLAVVARIRHTRTNYDELLTLGTERLAARTLMREKIGQVRLKWSGE